VTRARRLAVLVSAITVAVAVAVPLTAAATTVAAPVTRVVVVWTMPRYEPALIVPGVMGQSVVIPCPKAEPFAINGGADILSVKNSFPGGAGYVYPPWTSGGTAWNLFVYDPLMPVGQLFRAFAVCVG
jgi:hypothetical protein